MKKSELKEMIKSALMAESEITETPSVEEGVWAADKERIPEFIKAIETLKNEFYNVVGSDEVYDGLDSAVRAAGELLNMELREAEEDEDITVDDEEDITIDEPAEDEEGGIEVDAEADAGLTGDKKDVQAGLEAALEAAKTLGDQKLVDQIGNSITFFTRTHVVGQKVAEANMNVDIDSPAEDAEIGMELSEENIGLADLEEMGYEAGEKAAYTHATLRSKLRNRPDKLAYNKGFMQGVRDELGSSLDEGTETNLNESSNRFKKLAGLI